MNISVGSALAYSLLGFAIVFIMLIFLMIVMKIMSVALKVGSKKEEAVSKKAEEAAPALVIEKAKAPGSAGEIKLYNVSDRDAAMIMAIVADQMQRPLNELRFLSIKEI